ncbi:MAG: hypothetical protein CVU59_00025 [Deltaproteobacteria bacterium HGW-Deltaproteobacteria-17]|nr:MAG: hypothetical protein CVU59_00025 [Deltaproteobacteria bacterium HGW-Deltaproteobacteria-17]
MHHLHRFIFFSVAMVLAATSCSHVTFAPKSRQGLMLLAIPPSAQVYVDHRYWGTGIELERIPRLLPIGRHELLIVTPDHYPYYSTFTLKAHELLRRRPGLVRISEK